MVNLHSIALIAPCCIALVFTLQLFLEGKYKSDLSKESLLFFFFLVFQFSIMIILYQEKLYSIYRYLDSYYMACLLLLHPVFYFYILTLVKNKINKKSFLLHSSPAIFVFIISSAVYIILDKNEVTEYFKYYMYGYDSESNLISLLQTITLISKYIHTAQAVIYFFLVYFLLRTHLKNIAHMFSENTDVDLRWVFIFNIAYCITSLAGVFVNYIPPEILLTRTVYADTTMAIVGIFTLILGLKAAKQPSIGKIIDQLDEQTRFDESKNVSLNTKNIISKIDSVIVKHEMYLQPGLKVWDLVEKTGINRSYISHAINSEHKMSFSHFINKYRVEEACKLISLKKELNFESIAYDSGFNSLSTFNRSFMKFKGVSPSEFRDQLNRN
ncbi:MAG: AraC family transcriptional regulator [Bacteroidales bacterium]|nr:AraC family transcriptional regulator [Bacteroidales bacterium]MBN2818929.1 AraC family transcriptional regulator [Bacteroidales bacterium]